MPIAEFDLEGGGGRVIVDVDVPTRTQGVVRVARGGQELLKASQTFESALAGLKVVAGKVFDTLKDLRPDEAEVEMGFKLSAETGVVLARAGGEAHIVVKLVWKK